MINKLFSSSKFMIPFLMELEYMKNEVFRLRDNECKYTKFHSQFGEDRYIFEKLNSSRQGVFVDVGAGHPSYLSNTYFFEKNGWNGICIDADINQIELLKKDRSNVEWAAISPIEGEIEFFQASSPEYSSTVPKEEYKEPNQIQFKDTVRVPSFKLETILEKHKIGAIDILDLDVEGTELEVWSTLDYEKHKPKIVIIEYYTYGLADNSETIKTFFSKLPYKLVHTTPTNFIFVNYSA
ncbi:MAG: FkbM family methyltransferase [Pelatocladus maniniholoensis HA4357-MV3]|jgi:FkbM family methyltransferase|uniref:FkbM family methyltransferase n=1 Tax=Pelatocladus maniniholoensis HA4357-MV3 TaxID=1117104 RepID=A0A9E3LS69_9NOST|nr:FkbM family methyltransferase [Pelatocladus maniniholoensis HA4357-MV3]